MIQYGKSFVGRWLASVLILAALLASAVTLEGANYLNQAKAAANAVQGTRVTGLVGELLLASPFVVDRTDPPRPAPLRSLEEVGAEGAWLPGWLPAGIQSEPIASTWATTAGDQVTRIEFQVTYSGQTRPVMIVQVDGPSEKGLTYASPPPAWLEQADHGVASVTRTKRPARPADDAATVGGRDVRLARYESATINGRPTEAIHIPPTDRPALHGVLWQADGIHFYVGGYLPFEEIRAIAEGLTSGPR